MWKEFKEFATGGNVVDLAVAVVIGAAFGKIVSSLVENIMMPLLGILLNGINFEHLVWKVGNAEVTYGVFIQSIVDFFFIALAIFLFLRIVLKRRKEEEEVEEEEIDAQEQLLTEIRDLLKENHK